MDLAARTVAGQAAQHGRAGDAFAAQKIQNSQVERPVLPLVAFFEEDPDLLGHF